MKFLPTLLLVVAVAALAGSAMADEEEGEHTGEGTVQIGIKFRPEVCDPKAKNGDYVGVHYVGKLLDGTEFDNSYSRGEPIEFQLGAQQVIAGWDQGIFGMCVGEKRRLQIPPHLAYGDEGAGPIPAGASLIFDVELARITDAPQAAPDGYPGYEDYPYGGGEGAGEGGLEDDEGNVDLGGIDFAGSEYTGDGEEDHVEWS